MVKKEKQKKYGFFSNIIYVLRDSLSYKKSGIFFFLLDIICSILSPLLGALVPSIVVYALTNNLELSSYIYIVLGLSLLSFLFRTLKYAGEQKYQWYSTFARCTTSWNRISEKAITTDYLNVEPRDKQKIINKGFESLDSNWVGTERLMKEVPNLIINLIGMITYGTLVALYSPYLLIILFLMVATSLLWSIYGYKYMEKTRNQIEDIYHEQNILSKDTSNIDNAKDIRIYRLEKWLSTLFGVLVKKRCNYENKSGLRFLTGEISDCILLFARDAVAYLTLIVLVIEKTIDVSTFTFLIGLTAGFSTWSNGFSSSFNESRKASILVRDYRYALSIKDEFNHGVGLDLKTLEYPLDIKFNHVYFRYPGSEKDTLNDIDFEIKGGEKMALVGNNGAGKTTLVKLLCGLYKPTKGSIEINGHDLNEFNIDDYEGLISAVFQDVEPLALTIRENITCIADNSYDKDKMWKVLEDSGLKDKVESLKDKENSYITQRFSLEGVRLSGGETQKLMLARALYKNAPLLLLDEPTAALDPLSEEKMYKKYLEFAKDNTSVFISHRLSSTKFCDFIIFLNDGKIEEKGTHTELMNNKAMYREMFELQAKYYKEEKSNENQEEKLEF